jgi:hypothetical protein
MVKGKCAFEQLLERVEKRLKNLKEAELNPQSKLKIEELERNKRFLEQLVKAKNDGNKQGV